MKQYFSLLLGLIIILSSCNTEFKTNSTNSSFESLNSKTYYLEFDVAESDSTYIEEDIEIDLNSSVFIINDYIGDIGYKIEDIEFVISGYQGNELTQCDFDIAFVHLESIIGSGASITVPLYTFSQQGSYINVNHSAETRSIVEGYMDSEKKATLRVSGILSAKPAKFYCQFKIWIKSSSK